MTKMPPAHPHEHARAWLRSWLALVLLSVLAVAAWLRLAGVAWGLPYLYDIDEPFFVVPAFKMLASHDLNPHWFGHPGTTTIYTNALAFGLEGARALLTGEIQRAADLGKMFWSDPSRFYLIARLVSVLFGVSTVALTFTLARRFLGVPAALAATLLLAVSPMHVEYSQIARTDAQQTFLLLLFMFFSVRVAQQGRLKDYAWAGATLGLSIACKYPSIVASVGLIAAFAIDRRKADAAAPRWWQPVVIASIACVAGAFIGSPYMFLDFGQVLRDVATEGRSTHLSATSGGMPAALALYAQTLTLDNFGPAAAVCALLGLVTWIRNRSAGLPLLAMILVYLLFISALKLHWARWAVPLLPLMCILLGSSLEMGNALGTRSALVRRGLLAVAALLVAGCGWMGLQASLHGTAERIGEDNRSQANRWIEGHLPPGSRLAIERYTPQPDKRRYSVFMAEPTGELRQDNAPNFYASTSGALGTLKDPAALRQAGVNYIVLGNTLDRMEAEPGSYARELASYRQILASGTLVYESNPESGRSRGNRVRIYRLN